jgi:hypothetical protein
VIALLAAIGAFALAAVSTPGFGASPRPADPTCSRDYASGKPAAARTLRFEIDPAAGSGQRAAGRGPRAAGSAGAAQGDVKPVNHDKALAALRSLRPARKELILRINRLFEADGEAGIRRFHAIIARYTREGFDAELQVRYHPSAAQTGKIAAHREARRRGFTQLRLGFTFAYLPLPADASVSAAIRRGGAQLRSAILVRRRRLLPGAVSGTWGGRGRRGVDGEDARRGPSVLHASGRTRREGPDLGHRERL